MFQLFLIGQKDSTKRNMRAVPRWVENCSLPMIIVGFISSDNFIMLSEMVLSTPITTITVISDALQIVHFRTMISYYSLPFHPLFQGCSDLYANNQCSLLLLLSALNITISFSLSLSTLSLFISLQYTLKNIKFRANKSLPKWNTINMFND